jgi:hypothetical protein
MYMTQARQSRGLNESSGYDRMVPSRRTYLYGLAAPAVAIGVGLLTAAVIYSVGHSPAQSIWSNWVLYLGSGIVAAGLILASIGLRTLPAQEPDETGYKIKQTGGSHTINAANVGSGSISIGPRIASPAKREGSPTSEANRSADESVRDGDSHA